MFMWSEMVLHVKNIAFITIYIKMFNIFKVINENHACMY